jgi:hypothetical protein
MSDIADAWDPAAAAAVLRGVASGRLNAVAELGDPGVVVIDLDTGSSDAGSSDAGSPQLPPARLLPIGFDWILVGVSRHSPSPTPTSSGAAGAAVVSVDCDIAFTTAVGACRPWVTVDDLGEAVGAVRAAVSANPNAAVTAAQLLRRGGTGRPDDDLFCESLAYSTLQGGAEFAAWLDGRSRRAPRPSPRPPVRVERDGDELQITFDRPEVRNAYNAAARDLLVAALQLAVADRTIRSVALRGDGAAFCSGGDLDEFGTATDPPSAHLLRMGHNAGWWMAQCAGKVTAHLHGACVGAGIELPAFAGRVIATPDTRIRLPEVAMGLVPGAGGTASIPRRIGRHRTAWMAISGVVVSAPTGLSWGLVDSVTG